MSQKYLGMGGEGSMMHAIKSLQFNRNQLKNVRFRRWAKPDRKTFRIVRKQIGTPHPLSESEKKAIRSRIKREITVQQIKVLILFAISSALILWLTYYIFS